MTPKDAIRLLSTEIVQVVGCTEPVAIGYALRTLVRHLPFPPTPDNLSLTRLYISKDTYRNASTAVVPHLKVRGIAAAAAAGLASRANDFNVFADFDLKLARQFLKLKTHIRAIPVRRRGLFILAQFVELDTGIILRGRHDHVEKLVVFGKDITPREKLLPPPPKLDEIIALARARDPKLEALARNFILRQVPAENGFSLETQIARRVAGRMSGFSHPVMTITGSGNQGIFLGLPYRKLYTEQGDAILPAVVFSLLAQVYLSAKNDRLSADCGLATKAAPALAAGLAFARGAGPAEIQRIFREIPARLAGLTCEGAEPACGRKARRAFQIAQQFMD